MSNKSSALSALHAMQCLLPNTDSEGHFETQSSEIQQSLSSKKSLKKKEKKVFKKKISRSNSQTLKSDQGSDCCPTQSSPNKTQSKKRHLRSQNKFEFRTSSSTESQASTRYLVKIFLLKWWNFYFSSVKLATPSPKYSSSSSSDESDQYQGNEPVTSPPAKHHLRLLLLQRHLLPLVH